MTLAHYNNQPLDLVAVCLSHPLLGTPSVAERSGWYRHNGRVVGMVLAFPDGHTASLTFAEVDELQNDPHNVMSDQ